MHLSAPEGSSINDFIDKEDFPIHYATVDDAVAMVSRYGKGCMMATIDLKAAFRMVPIAAEEWDLLGLHWKRKYYVDTCLPFGLRSAPYLFNQFASALHWIMATNYAADVIHYLDDFLLAGPAGQPTCSESAETMLRVCERLGIPVALDKLKGPATTITFLGITINITLLLYNSCDYHLTNCKK